MEKKKLYLFLVGGTGVRVFKSLLFLLAAGIKPNEDYEFVPIVIDPHKENEDWKRTYEILDLYKKIQVSATAHSEKEGFFVSTIKKPSEYSNTEDANFSNTYDIDILEASQKKFSEYIGLNTMDYETKEFIKLLFSGKSKNSLGKEISILDIQMDIGFVGNPNIGSIVMHQLKNKDIFKVVANTMQEKDRVFIVGSIFGGTGAAGFPTILKIFRNALNDENLSNKQFLKNAIIGGLTVLPYFNIEEDENSPIRRAHFISKTQSALYYYKDTVNKQLNALYYLGDDHTDKPYRNDPGDNGQKNEAHLVEVIGATAIFDFLDTPEIDLLDRNLFKHFGLKETKDTVTFIEIDEETKKLFIPRFPQFFLFKLYCEKHLATEGIKQAWCKDIPLIDNAFLNSNNFYKNLKAFFGYFNEWLEELSDNKRSFVPFNLQVQELKNFINGIIPNPKKTILGLKKDDSFQFSEMDNELNRISNQYKNKDLKVEAKLLKFMFEVTEKCLMDRFNLKKQ